MKGSRVSHNADECDFLIECRFSVEFCAQPKYCWMAVLLYRAGCISDDFETAALFHFRARSELEIF